MNIFVIGGIACGKSTIINKFKEENRNDNIRFHSLDKICDKYYYDNSIDIGETVPNRKRLINLLGIDDVPENEDLKEVVIDKLKSESLKFSILDYAFGYLLRKHIALLPRNTINIIECSYTSYMHSLISSSYKSTGTYMIFVDSEVSYDAGTERAKRTGKDRTIFVKMHNMHKGAKVCLLESLNLNYENALKCTLSTEDYGKEVSETSQYIDFSNHINNIVNLKFFSFREK